MVRGAEHDGFSSVTASQEGLVKGHLGQQGHLVSESLA